MKLDAVRRSVVTPIQAIHLAFLFQAVCLLTLNASAETKISLDSPADTGCQMVETTLKAEGNLRFGEDGKAERPIRVFGELRYSTAPLPSHLASRRAARYYQTAQAQIFADDRLNHSRLDPARRTMIVVRESDRLTYYAPTGLLKRSDLDLVSVQCDPLAVGQLLAGRSVAVGATWKPSPQRIAETLGLDDVSDSSVECKLLSATAKIAKVQVQGSAEGSSLGATSKCKLEGTVTFDLKQKQVSRIEMTIQEDRDVSLYAPGFEIEAHVDTIISPAKAPQALSEENLAALADSAPTATALALEFASPTLDVAFTHPRDWRVTLHRNDLLVLRLVRDGQFIAQCNLTPVAKASDDRDADAARFQAHVEEALAKSAGQIEEISTAKTEANVEILRIPAKGVANEVPIRWVYYLLTDASGARVAVVFTMSEDRAKDFARADHDFIGGLRFAGENRSAKNDQRGSETR